MSVFVFGYGSLIWRPGFPARAARVARVAGYRRRLDQGSPDHRGTPERLGRVATLVPEAGAECWGVVFELDPREVDVPLVLEALDLRERGGYTRAIVRAAPRDAPDAPVDATTWIADTRNPHYLGPAPLAEMARQIRGAVGPSGANVEYVTRLADALRALGIDDPHVFAVERALAEA